MRILKYFVLLMLLSFVTISIFILTQKGKFEVEQQKVIKAPKGVVFSYINDLRNWQDFMSWAIEDPQMRFVEGKKSFGLNASMRWNGRDGDGNVLTNFVKESDSLSQNIWLKGSDCKMQWKLQEVNGKTKITCRVSGQMGFWFKIKSTFRGGAKKIFGNLLTRSLSNLDHTLDYEMNSFSANTSGVVFMKGSYYLKQTLNNNISKIGKNAIIVFEKLEKFCATNKIETNGKPFLVFHKYDPTNDFARVSYCLPIKEEIVTGSGSDIISGKLPYVKSVKTTMTGDWRHLPKAIAKGNAYFNKNIIAKDGSYEMILVMQKNKREVKSQSQWVSLIYQPIAVSAPKIAVKPVSKPIVKAAKPIEKPQEKSNNEFE